MKDKQTKKTSNKKLIIWLIVIILSILICFVIGLGIGFVVLGNGSWNDLFLPYTWYHIFEFTK